MVSNDRDNHTPISSVMEEEPKLLIYGRRAFSFFTGIFLIAILFVFPLYYRDYYFDILNVKYLLCQCVGDGCLRVGDGHRVTGN